MIETLLGIKQGSFIFPLVVLTGLTVLAKAVFGLHRSRSQDRRDFLELWAKQAPDDLWLEVAIRHQFGSYLPASVIRSLQRHPQAGRALMDVGTCWDLLEMDDATGVVRWRASRHRNVTWRRWERRGLVVAYFLLAFFGLMLGYVTAVASGASASSWLLWACCILLLGTAFACLTYGETLEVADRSMSRWLVAESISEVQRECVASAETVPETVVELIEVRRGH